MAKKNFLKKTLAIALAATFVLSAAPLAGLCGIALPSLGSVTANAAEEEPVWTVATDEMLRIEGNTIVGYTDKLAGNIEIPEKASNGVVITTIRENAFTNCSALTAVKIGDNISTIEEEAFQNCPNLEAIYFNATNCTVESYDNTNNYENCDKFKTIVFGENVTAIPANVCADSGTLQNVVFKGKVTSIGNNAFIGCSSLDDIDLSNVKTIGTGAFQNTSISSLVFSEDLKTINDNAFIGCKMTEITIPEKVTEIGHYAFQNCSNLKTIYFNAVKCTVNDYTNGNNYENCHNFTEIVFGENVTAIPANVCADSETLERVVIKGKVTSIENHAFVGCALKEIHLASYSEETFNFYALEIGEGNETVTKDIFTFGLKTVDKTNDEFGVTVSYPSNAFDEEVELSVTKVEGGRDDSAVYISDGELFKQTGCFDIKMVLANGSSTNAVQPDGKVTVKMEIPSDYIGKTNIKIVHRLSNGSRENFSFSPRSGEKKLKVSEDKKYWVFEVESFSEFEICEVNPVPSVLIRNNTGSKSIGYGETLRLTANAKNMPADAKIVWYVNDKLEGEGTTFEVSPESGSVKVTVKIVDADGETYAGAEITDSQNVSVKSGFFQKLISFFKNLFGINRIITQMLDVK